VPASDTEAHALIASALEGGSRIRSIVHDLSSFSHVDEGRQIALDVKQLLDSSIRMAESEIRYRARIVRDYQDVPPVVANDSRLGQVFLNLLVNAAQAIPEGEQETNEIRVATFQDEAGHVIVELADTGVGIRAEMLDKIFDPFVTTKPKGVGTGLGLYICRNIVNSLGGELSVTSSAAGSTFRVRLPAGLAAPQQGEASSAAVAPTPSRIRILVIDDEPSIVSTMERLLSPHHVEVARSGREAITALSNHDYDLAFCDLIMPDLTGMDVYTHLKTYRAGKEVCLVFMTGGAFTERARRFLATVPNEVLEKPFSLRAIEDIVARVSGIGGPGPG
jgi:CheY-like chemotaxis protein